MDVHEKYSSPYKDYFKEHGIGNLSGSRLEMTIKKRSGFYGMVANIDENVHKLRDFLKSENLDLNTILLYFGDNGTAGGAGTNKQSLLNNGYNAGMRGTKCLAYEGGHRNACVISWPKGLLNNGRKQFQLTTQLDLLPTLMELCRIPNVKNLAFDGQSIVPALYGKTLNDRTMIVHNMQLDTPVKYKEYAVMNGPWRLVRTSWRGKDSGEMLFNLEHDPGQKNNISQQHPEVHKKLLKSYDNWWECVSTNFADFAEIHIGEPQQNPVLITSHAWHGDGKVYNQKHIREGNPGNGFWTIKVANDGLYEFELRRWPREADTAIQSPLPGRFDIPFVTDLPKGKALEISKISFKIISSSGESIFNHEKLLKAIDKKLNFTIQLKAGSYRISSECQLNDSTKVGTYYLYATKLP